MMGSEKIFMKLQEKLESAAFLVSKGGAEKEAERGKCHMTSYRALPRFKSRTRKRAGLSASTSSCSSGSGSPLIWQASSSALSSALVIPRELKPPRI